MSFVLLGGVVCAAPVKVGLGVSHDDDSPIVPGAGKGPIIVPDVYQDNLVITFEEYHDDYTLCILDENDSIVYSIFVPTSVTTVVLPSTLSGDYELRLLTGGSYYFFGYVLF